MSPNSKMTIGEKTSTSTKLDVRICGDSDVADVFHHMETEKPSGKRFLIFGETDKMYGGFSSGTMGEYFSLKPSSCGKVSIKGRVDWEDGMELVEEGFSVWFVKYADLLKIRGYKAKAIRI
jgi:hypothetical protein